MREPEFVFCMNISLVLAQEKGNVGSTAEGSDVQGRAVVDIACEHIGTVGEELGCAFLVTPEQEEVMLLCRLSRYGIFLSDAPQGRMVQSCHATSIARANACCACAADKSTNDGRVRHGQ